MQLYALRSAESWGIGDLADLRRLAKWSATDLGAGILLINPLHAVTPVIPQQPSPYFPSSRGFRNVLYLRIEEVSGAAEGGIELEPLVAAGRALNRERYIDRDAIFRLKMQALGRLWLRFGGDPAFDTYRHEQGDALQQFAIFCALAEHYGRGWQAWPAEYRHPNTQAVTRYAAERADRVRFHQWLQWLLDAQLAQAAAELPVMQDLPIGVDPNGADAWAWQDVLAADVTVGAPPDKYNTLGQEGDCRPSSHISSVRPRTSHFAKSSAPLCAMRGGCASTMSWVCFGSTGFRRAWAQALVPMCGIWPMSCSLS